MIKKSPIPKHVLHYEYKFHEDCECWEFYKSILSADDTKLIIQLNGICYNGSSLDVYSTLTWERYSYDDLEYIRHISICTDNLRIALAYCNQFIYIRSLDDFSIMQVIKNQLYDIYKDAYICCNFSQWTVYQDILDGTQFKLQNQQKIGNSIKISHNWLSQHRQDIYTTQGSSIKRVGRNTSIIFLQSYLSCQLRIGNKIYIYQNARQMILKNKLGKTIRRFKQFYLAIHAIYQQAQPRLLYLQDDDSDTITVVDICTGKNRITVQNCGKYPNSLGQRLLVIKLQGKLNFEIYSIN